MCYAPMDTIGVGKSRNPRAVLCPAARVCRQGEDRTGQGRASHCHVVNDVPELSSVVSRSASPADTPKLPHCREGVSVNKKVAVPGSYLSSQLTTLKSLVLQPSGRLSFTSRSCRTGNGRPQKRPNLPGS